MDPQHGATDFEPGRVSRLYDKLAGQVDQLPNERRQELTDLVNAQQQELTELDQQHQQLLTRGVIAMPSKPKQGQAVDDGPMLFHKAVQALGKLSTAVDAIGSKCGKGRRYHEADRILSDLDQVFTRWEEETVGHRVNHGAGGPYRNATPSSSKPPAVRKR